MRHGNTVVDANTFYGLSGIKHRSGHDKDFFLPACKIPHLTFQFHPDSPVALGFLRGHIAHIETFAHHILIPAHIGSRCQVSAVVACPLVVFRIGRSCPDPGICPEIIGSAHPFPVQFVGGQFINDPQGLFMDLGVAERVPLPFKNTIHLFSSGCAQFQIIVLCGKAGQFQQPVAPGIKPVAQVVSEVRHKIAQTSDYKRHQQQWQQAGPPAWEQEFFEKFHSHKEECKISNIALFFLFTAPAV